MRSVSQTRNSYQTAEMSPDQPAKSRLISSQLDCSCEPLSPVLRNGAYERCKDFELRRRGCCGVGVGPSRPEIEFTKVDYRTLLLFFFPLVVGVNYVYLLAPLDQLADKFKFHTIAHGMFTLSDLGKARMLPSLRVLECISFHLSYCRDSALSIAIFS